MKKTKNKKEQKKEHKPKEEILATIKVVNGELIIDSADNVSDIDLMILFQEILTNFMRNLREEIKGGK